VKIFYKYCWIWNWSIETTCSGSLRFSLIQRPSLIWQCRQAWSQRKCKLFFYNFLKTCQSKWKVILVAKHVPVLKTHTISLWLLISGIPAVSETDKSVAKIHAFPWQHIYSENQTDIMNSNKVATYFVFFKCKSLDSKWTST